MHVGVGGDLGHRAGRDETSGVEHGHTICDGPHEAEVVFDEHDRQTRIAHAREQCAQDLLAGDVEPGRRLVKQQHARVRRERARDLQQSLPGARE
ncbi:MAG: hypothetical protein WAT66_07915, partial [Actinomycetota bacterium]